MTEAENPAQERDDSNSEMDSLVKWRREKVWELKSCGLTIDEIAETLKPKEGIKISRGTVFSDLKAVRLDIQRELFNYTDELVFELHLTLHGLQETIKEAWKVVEDEPGKKLEALRLIEDCYVKRFALMTDNKSFIEYITIFGKGRDRTESMRELMRGQ